MLLSLAAPAALIFAACGSDSAVSGAGATFPQPVYDQWSADIKKSDNISVNYNPLGSGGGIAQFTAGTVDFGGTDVAMTDEELAAAEKKGTPLHIPTVFGAVTVVYNLPGVKSGIRLDGATLAEIFLGKIEVWNDSKITLQNPGRDLPALKITVIHRSDESGTTKLYTTYLADYSDPWEQEVGAGKSIKWPTGTGAAKNAGVAGGVKQTEGAIGYVELAYALQSNFTTAALKNASGVYVAPTFKSTAAAGRGLKLPADLRFSATNSPNPQAYPIAAATFLLLYKDMCRAGVKVPAAENVKAFLDYGLGAGQQIARQLDFVPLPTAVHKAAQAKAAALTCNGAPLE